jgi:hypothetical protein
MPCLSAWLVACADASPVPAGDPVQDSPDTDLPQDVEPDLQPVPAAIVRGLGPAMRATLAAVTQVRHSAVAELLDHMRRAQASGCGEVTSYDDGTSTWVGTCDGAVFLDVDLSWNDRDLLALNDATRPWTDAWLPLGCPALNPETPAAGSIPSVGFGGHFTQVIDGQPLLHVRGTFSDVLPSWPGCTAARTWADGYADDPDAAPDAWTGTALEAQRLEVGRVRSADAALLTVDGTLGGLPGDFPHLDVVGGAWLVGPTGSAPRGVWSMRDEAGTWFEATFDGGVCAVLRAPGYADTPACLSDDDVAALTSLTEAAVP